MVEIMLRDSKNGYACYCMPYGKPDDINLSNFRAFLVNHFTKYGYEGYSYEIDNIFHPYSAYLYVADKDHQILATSRVTIKSPGNILPFEMGFKKNGSSYHLDEMDGIGDINSFAFKSYKALPLLFACLGKYTYSHDMHKVYCLLDRQNQRISGLYLSAGFGYSDKFSEEVSFPSFGKTIDGVFMPTSWTIMEMGQSKIKEYHDQAGNRVGVAA